MEGYVCKFKKRDEIELSNDGMKKEDLVEQCDGNKRRKRI